MTYHLLLASGSPRRHELLGRLGVEFEALEPRGVDESAVEGRAAERCAALAARKGEWGLRHYAGATRRLLAIGADTLVSLDETEIIGKPTDRDDACRILRRLSGEVHRVLSAVAVARPGGETAVAVESSEVRFHELTAERIERYVASGDADDKAGAYGIQSAGKELVAGFRGCYYGIMGLPLSLLVSLLPPDAGIEWTCDCHRHPLQMGGRPCGSVVES